MAFCPRKVPQLVEIANLLSEGNALPPMRDSKRGTLEGLSHLRLQRGDIPLEDGYIVLQRRDALRIEARRREITNSIRGDKRCRTELERRDLPPR